jgi:hypothetical protein
MGAQQNAPSWVIDSFPIGRGINKSMSRLDVAVRCPLGQRTLRGHYPTNMSAIQQLRKPIACLNQGRRNPWLRHRMSRISYYDQLGFGPSSMQIPGGFHWANDIVSALYDHRWNVTNSIDIPQELIIHLKKSAIDKVVAFNPSKGLGKMIFAKASGPEGVGQ